MNQKKQRKARHLCLILELTVIVAGAVWCAVTLIGRGAAPSFAIDPDASPQEVIQAFAQANDLSAEDYPESVVALLERNPETMDFVLNYPMEYGKDHAVDLSEYESSESVPLFLQWDKRWGYIDYGSDVAGITGCGPVCLAMVGYYLTGDKSFSPDKVLQFALDNGYCVPGNGTSWTLISEGGVRLGLDVTEIPLDEDRMVRNLQVDNPIICVMGPGAFTTSGHYIVLTGWEDGKFRVNDPNSRGNSERLWSYDEIQDQIRNIWVIRK